MIIHSETRVVPSRPNVLTLVAKDGTYLYVHCSIYGDAAVLNDKYKENLDVFKRAISSTTEELPEIVQQVYNYLPEPINILAYFLLLIQDIDISDISIHDAIGALHAISTVVALRKFTTIYEDVRKSVRFTMSIKDEYQLAYDAFFQTAIPFENLTAAPVSYVSSSSESTEGSSGGGSKSIFEMSKDDDTELSDDDMEAMFAELDAFEFPEPIAMEDTALEDEPEPEPEPAPAAPDPAEDAAAKRRAKLMAL